MRANTQRRLIRNQPPSPAGLAAISQILVSAGRAASTTKSHIREVRRLKRFASDFGFPPILNTEDVRTFLNSDRMVTSFMSHLAFSGFAFRTARKILFSLRGATATPDSVDPKKFSRYVMSALIGYRALYIPKPPRPIVSLPGFRFCAQSSLGDLLDPAVSFLMAVYGPSRRTVNIARWRAAAFIGYKGCLRRSEYVGFALLSPCVQFDNFSITNLRKLMSKAHLSIPDLWQEVVHALHPKAILAITVTSSKCNPFPAQIRILRDIKEPSLCAVAAAAFWFVLQGPTLEIDDPFLNVKEGLLPTRGITAAEVLNPLRAFLLASNTQSEADCARTTLHGLRHGGATAAVLGGASEAQTQALGRWRGRSVTVYVSTSLSTQALVASDAISGALSSSPVPLLCSAASGSPPRSPILHYPSGVSW